MARTVQLFPGVRVDALLEPLADGGVRDDEVESAELVVELADDLDRTIDVGDVEHLHPRAAARGGDLLRQRLELLLASCADDDLHAFASDAQRKRAADPARSPGDER